jgi:hypothetical protein
MCFAGRQRGAEPGGPGRVPRTVCNSLPALQPIKGGDTLRSQLIHKLGGANRLCRLRMPLTLPIMISRFYVLPLATALISCRTTGVQPHALEQSVALAALADELAHGPLPDTVYLLNRLTGTTTQAPDSAAWLEGLLPSRFLARMPAALFYRYWLANRASAPLGRSDQIAERPVRWIGDVRESSLPSGSGVYSLSRVGFSATADSALIEVGFACPGLCGSENLYLYLKGPNGWERHRSLRSMVH